MSAEMFWLDLLNVALVIALFLIGLFCLLTRRRVFKQVIGLKVMLQGVVLAWRPKGLPLSGRVATPCPHGPPVLHLPAER